MRSWKSSSAMCVLLGCVSCSELLGLDELSYDSPADGGGPETSKTSAVTDVSGAANATDGATLTTPSEDGGTATEFDAAAETHDDTLTTDSSQTTDESNPANGTTGNDDGLGSDPDDSPGAQSPSGTSMVDEPAVPPVPPTTNVDELPPDDVDAGVPGEQLEAGPTETGVQPGTGGTPGANEGTDADGNDSGSGGASSGTGGGGDGTDTDTTDVADTTDDDTDTTDDDADTTDDDTDSIEPEPAPDPVPSDAGATPSCSLLVSELNDDFGPTSSFQSELDQQCWGQVNANEIFSMGIQPSLGALSVIPEPISSWYNRSTGPLVYRAVDGNFVIETEVAVHTPGETTIPTTQFAGGGLLVYDPERTVDLNDVYYLIGSGTLSGSQTGIKSEFTEDRLTTQKLDASVGPNNKLRLCRIAGKVHTLYAEPGSSVWQAFSYDETQYQVLPNRVFVGLIAYQYLAGNGRQTQVDFSYVSISTDVSDSADCAALQLP